MAPKILINALLLMALAGCRPSGPTQEDIAAQIRRDVPPGWTMLSSNNAITISTDREVTIIGRLGNGPDPRDDAGYKAPYSLTLRFVPLLTSREFRELKAKRDLFLYTLDHGASGKTEYGEAMKGYEKNQLPQFFTRAYSVFVDRPVDRFVVVRPTNTLVQAEAMLSAFAKFLTPYEK